MLFLLSKMKQRHYLTVKNCILKSPAAKSPADSTRKCKYLAWFSECFFFKSIFR